MAVAAIDIGTNSVRILVQADGRDLERRAVVTRLGEGVGHSGVLRADAIERTLTELREHRRLLDRC